jgi:hypothetical protein
VVDDPPLQASVKVAIAIDSASSASSVFGRNPTAQPMTHFVTSSTSAIRYALLLRRAYQIVVKSEEKPVLVEQLAA